MPKKSKGTGERLGQGGQLEWTMRPKKKPGWQLTKTGKLLKNAQQAASSLLKKAHDEPEWGRANTGIIVFCLKYLRGVDAQLPGQTTQTPQNAIEILKLRNKVRKEEQKKKKEIPGQGDLDFDSAENPF